MFKRIFLYSVLALVLIAGNFLYVGAGDITPTGVSQKDLVQYLTNVKTIANQLNFQINNRCYGNAGLAINGTTATLINIANAIDYTVGGVFYSKGATSAISVSAAVQAVSTYCKYLITLNSSGTVTATKGTNGATSAAATLPDVPTSNCPIGYIEVKTNGATTFTLGTTSLNDSGVTATYVNLATVSASSSPSATSTDLSLTGL